MDNLPKSIKYYIADRERQVGTGLRAIYLKYFILFGGQLGMPVSTIRIFLRYCRHGATPPVIFCENVTLLKEKGSIWLTL